MDLTNVVPEISSELDIVKDGDDCASHLKFIPTIRIIRKHTKLMQQTEKDHDSGVASSSVVKTPQKMEILIQQRLQGWRG